jgi:hypothetical protein
MTDVAPMQANWSAILAGATPLEQATDLIESSSQQVEAALTADPKLEDELLAAAEKRLTATFDPETYQGFWELLRGTFGEEGAYLVHFYFMARDQEAQRATVEANASPTTVAFMRKLVTRLGPELDAAFQIWQELPHAWKTLNRDVYFDVIRQRYYVRLLLQKLNGEQTLLEGTPDSILGLTRSLLITLRWMQSADSFTQSYIDQFLDEAVPLIAMLKREDEPSGDGQPGDVQT